NLKHQRLRNFAARNQGLIIYPFSTLPVAKRTRAQILEQARHIPLPLSGSSSSDEESEDIFEMGDQTLKQLAAPTFDPNLLCITPPGFIQPQMQHQFRPPQFQQAQIQHQPQSGGMSLEEIVKPMATNTLQFQQEIRSGLKNLENQVSQLADTVGKLQAQNSNKLPSQPEKNPRENASVISLRSGRS
ncbi:Protein scabrous, partial [Bienertia sinuspersici]